MAIKLPERTYFTFPELMARWQCSENDVRELMVRGDLVPSIFHSGGVEPTREFADGVWLPSSVVGVPDPTYAQGLLYLRTFRPTGPFTGDFLYASYERESSPILWLLRGGEHRTVAMEEVLEDGVISMEEIALVERNLAATATGAGGEKKVATVERNTLLTIIAVLCKEAKMDFMKPAKTAGLIQGAAAQMGVSIGETTIETHLKKIPDALATRTR